MNPDFCPTCGAEVPEGARVCPECGSDEETGWSERARYESLGIPADESFDYEDYVKREFGGGRPRDRRAGKKLLIRVATILLLAAFVPGLLYLLFYAFGGLFQK